MFINDPISRSNNNCPRNNYVHAPNTCTIPTCVHYNTPVCVAIDSNESFHPKFNNSEALCGKMRHLNCHNRFINGPIDNRVSHKSCCHHTREENPIIAPVFIHPCHICNSTVSCTCLPHGHMHTVTHPHCCMAKQGIYVVPKTYM